jgi:hypothetical protein
MNKWYLCGASNPENDLKLFLQTLPTFNLMFFSLSAKQRTVNREQLSVISKQLSVNSYSYGP